MVEWQAVSCNILPNVQPTHPTLIREPFDRPGWIYEEKYDGWQIVAHKGV